MSEENIKGIPEEETAELQNEEITETTEEIPEEGYEDYRTSLCSLQPNR